MLGIKSVDDEKSILYGTDHLSLNEIQKLLRGLNHKRETAMAIGEAPNDDLLSILLESNHKEVISHDMEGQVLSINTTISEISEAITTFFYGIRVRYHHLLADKSIDKLESSTSNKGSQRNLQENTFNNTSMHML